LPGRGLQPHGKRRIPVYILNLHDALAPVMGRIAACGRDARAPRRAGDAPQCPAVTEPNLPHTQACRGRAAVGASMPCPNLQGTCTVPEPRQHSRTTTGCSGRNSSDESTAKRVCRRSGAAFTEEDAIASRSNESCFAVHIFEVLYALGVLAVRFCSEVI
jgi:hypothetical protein